MQTHYSSPPHIVCHVYPTTCLNHYPLLKPKATHNRDPHKEQPAPAAEGGTHLHLAQPAWSPHPNHVTH